MNFRQLEHFAAVAQALNFHRAAERLNLSQQAVSKSILQLEALLNVRLLERGRQSVLLTEQGRQLLPYALEVIASARRFEEAASAVSGNPVGSLAVGATPTFVESVLPAVLDRFQERFPEMAVKVDRADFGALTSQMLRGDLDLLLSTAPEDIPRHLVNARIIGQDRNVVVVRAGHPLAGKAEVTFGDLLAFPFIQMLNYPRGSGYLARLAATGADQLPSPRLAVGSMVLGIDRVLATDGWWITPRLLVSRRLREGRMVELPIEPVDTNWDLIMATRRQSRSSMAQRIFEELVGEQLAIESGRVHSDGE